MIGTRLAHYEIVAHLGSGGMGDVYAATDLKLGRRVAVKLLPHGVTHDADRLVRFKREARVLAALNHTNIAAIHGIEDDGERRFLVMELVEGETLAERLAHGPLPIREVLAIAGQIVDALDAAHEKGIVHRDLKPANIKVTPGGVVKLLDFGLAKDTAVDAAELSHMATRTAVETRAGLILGTAAYMSPEQARGLAVDKRTDIWAFGCLLYEMLAARAAFARATITDTLAAVIEREPDWSALPSATPPTVRRLIERCLTKDSRRRLRDVGDVAIDLEDQSISDAVKPTPTADSTSDTLRRWRMSAIASTLALIGTSVALAVMFARAPGSTPTPTAAIVAARLTNYAGNQSWATLAPDGQSFAFVSDHGGQPDIWLRQVSGGEPVRLTNDTVPELDLAFSPDGEHIYFSRVDGGEQAVWRIGRLGGQIQKVVNGAHSPAPSPDSRSLAYMVPESDPNFETLGVSPLDGGSRRTLAEHIPNFPRVRPAWSPDGFRIAYVRAGLLQPANLFVVDLRDGSERQVTRFTRVGPNVGQSIWFPDNRHLALTYSASSSPATGLNDLGVLDVTDGSISRITTTIDDSFMSPSISADGSRLIATATSEVREVWKVPLGSRDPDVNGRAAVRLIDATQAPLFTFLSRDKRVLLFNSPASGSRNLWTMPLDGTSAAQQITHALGDAIQHGALSPDRKRVVFVSTAGGWADLWIQNVDGSDLRQLTSDPASEAWPTWSPDGGSILFDSRDGAGHQTKLMSAAGGPTRKLIDGRFRGDWAEQPDGTGTWIVTSDGVGAIRLIDVEQGVVAWQERAPGSSSALPMFSPDRRSIAVQFQEARETDAINIIDVTTRQRRVAARLPFRVLFRVDWVDDGTALIVNRSDRMSHIVLFDRLWGREVP